TLLSQRTSLYAEEGSAHRQTNMYFDRPNRRALYEVRSSPAQKANFAIPPDVQDGLSLLYAMRTRQLAAGQRITMPVADDGSLYTVEMVAAAQEHTTVPLGDFDAWHVRVRIVDDKQQ